MQERQLQYLVKVVDQASAQLTKIGNDLDRLDRQNKASAQTNAMAGASMLQMAGAFGIATTAVGAIQQGVQFLNAQFRESVQAANEYNSAFIGLSSVAAAFGEDQDKAKAAAQDLAKDGLMPVSEAAAGLKNLLGSKFNLDESIQLMKAFKDAAAFNRQGTLEFGQAIVGATQGIKNQNSIMVDNVGITKNLSIILQEAGYSVQDLQRVTTDAGVRQALFNGLMREGAVFAGDSARAAETLAGSQSTLDTAVKGLHNTLGQMLSPALVLLNTNMTDATNAANQGIQPAMANVAKSFVIAAEVASVAGSAIKTALVAAAQAGVNVTKAMLALQSGDYKGAGDNFLKLVGDLGTTIDKGGQEINRIKDNTQKVLNKIATDGVGSFGNVARGAMGDISGAVGNEGGKITDKLNQIQQKIADINRNIQEQVTSFTRNVAQATADFDRQIRDLVIKHRQAMAELKSQISDLNESYNENQQERLDSHNDRLTSIKEKYDDETSTLKDNLRRQMADSKIADAQLIKFFDEKVKSLEAKRDKEIADENADYEKQEAKEKKRYEKALADLQTKLNAELEIEKKHQDEFNKFKDAVAEDDITRAQQQFDRQMEQMRYQHDIRMKELERQLQEEEALKNKYRGTNVTTGTTYKSSGASNPANSKATPSKSYAQSNPLGLTINFTQNNQNVANAKAALTQALPSLGWLIR